MKSDTPIHIRLSAEEYQQYKDMADELGLPFATFVKLVLRQTAEQVFDRMTPANVTIVDELDNKRH